MDGCWQEDCQSGFGLTIEAEELQTKHKANQKMSKSFQVGCEDIIEELVWRCWWERVCAVELSCVFKNNMFMGDICPGCPCTDAQSPQNMSSVLGSKSAILQPSSLLCGVVSKYPEANLFIRSNIYQTRTISLWSFPKNVVPVSFVFEDCSKSLEATSVALEAAWLGLVAALLALEAS